MGVGVRLLGPFAIRIDGRPSTRPGTKGCALLGYLATRAEWVDRSELVGLLYPEASSTHARANLRQLLHNVARIVPTLEREGTRLRWTPDSDLARFLDAVEHGDAAAALEAWGGDLLDDLEPLDEPAFLDWLDLERERLAGLWRGVALDEAERLMAMGRHADAAEPLQRIVARDSLDEQAVTTLMRALAVAGRLPQALSAYARFEERLSRELDLRPTPKTRDLVDALRAGDTAPSTSAYRSAPLPAPVTLPRMRHEPIGREADLAALDQAFAADSRWVTLTGLGGSGKSHLARAYAARTSGTTPVAWADGRLGIDAHELRRELLHACGFDDDDDLALERRLSVLGEAPYLLVIDDPADREAARVVATSLLARDTSGVRLLVTARSELGGADEHVMPLTGLAPERGAELLLDAVRRRGREPIASDRPAAERIARATGGLPLALRLAAGWCELIPMDELAARVERSAALLADPSDEAGLARVVDDTLGSLQNDDRAAFARLGAFSDPFSATAAEAVGVSIPVLLSLRNRGLVERYGDDRLTLHPLLAEEAADELRRDPRADDVLRMHAEHYLNGVAEAGLDDDRRPRALARLDAVRRDLLRAWSWATRHDRRDLLDAALANWVAWNEAATRHRELVATVAAATPDAPPLAHARFRFAAAARSSDEHAHAVVEACLEVFEREAAWTDAARALENLAVRAVRRGDFGNAAHLADRGLTVAQRAGARALRVSLLNVRASPEIAARDYARAEELYRSAIANGDEAPLAADRARGNLADLCISLGRPREAIALTRASLGVARARHDVEYALRRRHVLARGLRAAGDDTEAEALLRRQLDDLADARLDPSLTAVLRWLAAGHLMRLLARSGRTDEATTLWQESTTPPDERPWRRGAWLATGGWLALQAGDPARADALLSEALDAFAATPATPHSEEAEARIAAQLSGSASALAVERGAVARRRCAEALDGSLRAGLPPLLLASLLAAARLELHRGFRRRACLLLARVLADPRCHAETRRTARRSAVQAGLAMPDAQPVRDARLHGLARSMLRRMR